MPKLETDLIINIRWDKSPDRRVMGRKTKFKIFGMAEGWLGIFPQSASHRANGSKIRVSLKGDCGWPFIQEEGRRNRDLLQQDFRRDAPGGMKGGWERLA